MKLKDIVSLPDELLKGYNNECCDEFISKLANIEIPVATHSEIAVAPIPFDIQQLQQRIKELEELNKSYKDRLEYHREVTVAQRDKCISALREVCKDKYKLAKWYKQAQQCLDEVCPKHYINPDKPKQIEPLVEIQATASDCWKSMIVWNRRKINEIIERLNSGQP